MSAAVPDATPSPFHPGEQRVQQRLGVRDAIEPWARRVVRPALPEEHRHFYASLSFLVLGARDASGQPWATLVAGDPGFASTPDPTTLAVAALPSPGDALADALRAGDDLGILGIELPTRRRNRVNGRIAARDGAGLSLAVSQSFGNCPQYITPRRVRVASADTASARRAERGTALTPSQRAWIEGADTFFIASGYGSASESRSHGLDVSHRGGAPGFVETTGPGEVVFPDYAGNNHFNTLGNLVMDARVGLLFVEVGTGALLQVTGRAAIDWSPPQELRDTGARRRVRVAIDAVVEHDPDRPLCLETAGDALRELRVVTRRAESDDVVSFTLAARDGGPLPSFEAGQHLPVVLSGPSGVLRRSYSLSGPADAGTYRISVKREPCGAASGFLHDHLAEGDVLLAARPAGSFVLHETSPRPAVLVSAGVGLTPLVSMLHAASQRPERPVWFVHGARDGAHHPLRREVDTLVATTPHLRRHVVYSRPRPADRERAGRDFDDVGRIDGALLAELLPDLEADFYLCGPLPFLDALHGDLEARGVPAEQIHSERFATGA